MHVNWSQPGKFKWQILNFPTAGKSLKQHGKAAKKSQDGEEHTVRCFDVTRAVPSRIR